MTATQWGEVLASYSLQVFVVMMFGRWLERAAARPSYQSAVWSGCFVSTLVLGCVAVILPRLHLIQPWSLLQPRHLLTAMQCRPTLVGYCSLCGALVRRSQQ